MVRRTDPMVLLLLISMITFADSVRAAQLYTYDTYDAETNERVVQTMRRIHSRPDGRFDVAIEWASLEGDRSGTETYLLGPNWATLEWASSNTPDDTDLTGRREGNRLFIQGRHRGDEVDKTYDIDAKPFHVNPGLGLQSFVTSGEEKMEFWTLRPDNLGKYKMKAERERVETIEVDETSMEAVRVKWGLTGLRAMFFSQTMWFHPTSGVLVRSEASRGKWSQLVEQRPTP